MSTVTTEEGSVGVLLQKLWVLYSDRKSNVVCLFLVFKVSVINCNILFVRHRKFFFLFVCFVVAEGSQAPLSIQSNHWI